MVSPAAPAPDTPPPPPPVSAGGTYSLQSIAVGCKLFMRRPGPDGAPEERRAEVLSIRDAGAGARDFFVHWDAFNKRLDEWVPGARVVLGRELEWPRARAPPKKGGAHSPAPTPAPAAKARAPGKAPRAGSLLRRATANAGALALASPAAASPPRAAGTLKRKAPPDEEEEEDADADGDADADAEGEADAEADPDADAEGDMDVDEDGAPPSAFSKAQEIEKLRTSGSMTQSISEIARVKNLNRLQIGRHEVEAWYFSPYPQEYAYLPVLFLCEFCLSFFPSRVMLGRHRQRCTLLHPPGNEIYRHEDISFFEIDGRRQLTWCRNLSLLSKCFLDHKTLYYDVTPFMYYVMTQRDSTGCHIIGYFSKEKESAESYNVACILTLPQHQRHGYGTTLIEFSYELSKKEGKLGSPEKPLSDLGLLGYRAYWAETIVELLINSADGELSIDDIAQKTAITHADVMNTCTTLQLFKHYKGQHIICLNNAVLERHEKARAKRRRRIHPEHLIWKPPVFTRDQLRFGW